MPDTPPADQRLGARALDLVRMEESSRAKQFVQRLLFDVTRGKLLVDGTDALDLGAAAWELELSSDTAAWARHAATCDLTPDQAVRARSMLIGALREQNLLREAYDVICSAGEQPEDASADALWQLHINEGPVLVAMGEPEEALRRYDQAEQLATAASIDAGLLSVLEINRGAALNECGRDQEAIAAYQRALHSGAGSHEPSLRHNLANALRKLERYEEAREQYELAYNASDNPRMRGAVLSNLARLLLATGQRARAKSMMKDAFRLRCEGADPAGQAITAEELGKLLVQESDYRSAHDWFVIAKECRQSVGLPDDPDLERYGTTTAAAIAYLDQNPAVAGHLLVDRLRTVMPGDWPLVVADELPAALQAALERLGREVGDDPARAVEDRWITRYLDRIIAVGHQLAFAELTERLAGLKGVMDTAREFIRRQLWLERKRFYESARAVLEAPIADDAIVMLELRAEDAGFDRAALVELRGLIAACREKGTDQAFAELPEMHPRELINRFEMVGYWRESMQIVVAHPEDLLSDETIDLLTQARDVAGPSGRARVEQHIAVLQRSRQVGIVRAFDEVCGGERARGFKIAMAPLGHVDVDTPDGDPSDRIGKAKSEVDRFITWNEPMLVRKARLELAQAFLSETAGERSVNLRAALQTFEEILTDGMAGLDMGEVWLGIGAAHRELAVLEPAADNHLGRAENAYKNALRESPVQSFPERARLAARGLHDLISLYLDQPRMHSGTIILRQLRSHACDVAMEATDELIRSGEVRDPSAERADWLWAYQRVVEDRVALGQYATALAAAESGRGRGFLAEISQIEHLPQAVPAALADIEAKIRTRLRATRSSGDPAAIKAAISDLQVVHNKIAEVAPEFASMRSYSAPTADELSAFASNLPNGVVALCWYTTPAECFAFLLRGADGTVRASRTGVDQRRLLEFVQLAVGDFWQRPDVADQRISPGWTELAGALVPKAWHPYVEAANSLVLVPHGPLSDIPLHALPHRWMGGRSLIETADVSYLPGLVLGHRLRARSTTGRTAIVLAHSGTTSDEAGASPFEVEARVVAKVLDTPHLYIGSNARRRVLEEFAPEAGIVHIATHGVFNPDDPMGSMLLLSDGSRDGSETVTARDVLQLPRLTSQVVVLSGCETSRHSTDLGGESNGLVRAFLVAGASAVVAGQWRVDSPSTARLMEHFYKELQSGEPIARSLRTASLELKSAHATQHPYYWAPFVTTGA